MDCKLQLLYITLAVASIVKGQQDGTIALFQNGQSSPSFMSGIVQVYYKGEWQGVCMGKGFGGTEAAVICRQLGYTNVINYAVAENRIFDSIKNATLSSVHCDDANYQVLFQCRFTWETCSTNQAVIVTCTNTESSSAIYTGQLRLSGGHYSNEGVVEIYCNKKWGTVCDDMFAIEEADVICSQLGYTIAFSWHSVSRIVNQPIWLDSPICAEKSYHNCIGSCQWCPLKSTTDNCLAGNIVYVECGHDYSNNIDPQPFVQCDAPDYTVAALVMIIGVAIAFIVSWSVILPLCVYCCYIGVGVRARGVAVSTRSYCRIWKITRSVFKLPFYIRHTFVLHSFQ